ncbi:MULTISPECIES: hypothetical protein [unclassified Frigoribacterium]|uniref:hypothetical protein n=1 Tax=unclassified Frigoribacterium TaxID=2627005 RepID=UPI0006FE4EE1|nr:MULTISPECIES: hypothetical protein [unclassified Frigoribacterium]KQO46337.1 hypothetical protein ASF07_00750 [Frigoribacterium sp. Leaf254]KQT38430.1 hypothetical protein ASG28_00750 [Frigoribacterium sp. Leaf415]
MFSNGFSLVGVLYPVFFVVVFALAVTLAVLLIRTLLWVIRALTVYTRERELRIDLLLAGDDGPAGPVDPSAPGVPGGPVA